MIVGHLAFAYIGKRTFFKTENYPLLIAASYGPDMVDKTLSVLLGFAGRNFGHSLALLVALAATAWVLSLSLKRDTRWLTACAVMWLAHLGGDFVRPVILFWPFLGSFTGDPFAFAGVFHRMYIEIRFPDQLALEICLVAIALCLVAEVPRRLRSLAVVRALTGDKVAR
jgi:hypothetical protein